MTGPTLTRRTALAAGAALPLTAALGSTARAGADLAGPSMATHNRFALGGFEVTTLLAGTRTVTDDPQGIFGMNVDKPTFEAASAENFIPADKVQFFFTPTVVNTGSELVLFDTGLNADGITGALASAGYTPDQVDIIVITHNHGDHIGGMMNGDAPTFPNARYVTGAVEFDTSAGNERFEANVKPMAEKMTMLDDGGAVASGITAMAAFGHTPGHMAYMIESEGKGLVLIADAANHYVWSLAYPDWEVKFDRDKAAAAATRKKLLGMIAADRLPFIGYHMPFPGIGYVEAKDSGFRYVPATYQMML